MKTLRSMLVLCVPFLVAGAGHPSGIAAQDGTVVLHAERVLDGRGGVLLDRDVVIRDGRIAEVVAGGQGRGDVRYELAGLTVMPGLIDTHVHINWHFDRPTGKTHSGQVEETAEQTALYAAENAWETLQGGVTTVQSLGSPVDLPLREFVNEGRIPGPRVLTSISPINAGTGGPDAIRARVADLADQGADVIKIFAAGSIRDGGAPTLSQDQLDAACGEARSRGLRTLVHAYDAETVRRVVQARCTGVEHGALLDLPTLRLMAANGVYFDPNIDLVFRNYFENDESFLGVGNYTEEGFDAMRRALPLALRVFKDALTVPDLKVVFGTDAVAGSHGRNYQELVYRIEVGGQDPMAAVVSATSLAAEELGLADRIGAVAAGMEADLIALDGNPLEDPGALGRVVFVMREGRIYKNVRAPR